MVTLVCAVVGGPGGAFPVDIDASLSVGHLQKAIKESKPNDLKGVDADKLQLFLAKKGGAWLTGAGAAALTPADVIPVTQDENGNSQGFEQMDSTLWLNDPKYFGEKFTPGAGQVHVLAVAPVLKDKKRKRDAALAAAQETKERDFDEFLENCPKQGSLPTEGDFLQLFEWNDQDCGEVKDITAIGNIVGFTGSRFFVRKEVLCILENLKRFKRNFDSGDLDMQFVLLGGPGTGKSCVLALLCFYVAVTTEQPVLWFRRVLGGRGTSVIRLFYKKKYYEWDAGNGEKYSRVHDEMNSRTSGFFWPCLDGFDHKTVYSFHSRGLTNFTLLTTSGQFHVKGEGASFVTLCLTPYWKLADLELLSRAFKEPAEDDIADRYFVSGGCLREFLNVDARHRVKRALDQVKTSDHVRFLLASLGFSSDEQIDRLRYLEPKMFEELIGIVRGRKDDRLEDVALEGYFHALVRGGQPIVIDYCKYDNGNRTEMKQEWQDKDKGSMRCPPASKIQCSGDSVDDCVQVMESWAADLSFADYWIPADSLCETIDAVAKCKFPDEQESRICFLQLTKAQKHKCDEDVLWRLAQPFVGKAKVCFIALMSLKDAEIRSDFQLMPAVITRSEVLKHIPLYVARYRFG